MVKISWKNALIAKEMYKKDSTFSSFSSIPTYTPYLLFSITLVGTRGNITRHWKRSGVKLIGNQEN